MSRIGRKPIPLPKGVSVHIEKNRVTVRGPKGELSRVFDPEMEIVEEGGALHVRRPSDERQQRAIHGLTRALLANMVTGVSEGFKKELEVQGVGYKVDLESDGSLLMSLGFSHPVRIQPPAGVKFQIDPRTRVVTVSGIDREAVGQIAAVIRRTRPVEPYRGKGVRYVGEQIRRKTGKTGA